MESDIRFSTQGVRILSQCISLSWVVVSAILRFMAEIDKHKPGAFSWIELSTTDQNAAKTFYTSLFGWTFQDFPMGPDDSYTMFSLKGRTPAAAYTMRRDEQQMHVPPHWNLYISVE